MLAFPYFSPRDNGSIPFYDETTTSSSYPNSTTSSLPCEKLPQYTGYIALVVTCVLFGSNFIPVKKYETGDGVFFQFIQCCAVGVYGIIFNIIIGIHPFEPLAMLSGAMWATGNLCCVLIIRSLGIGIGPVLWSLQALVLGWASGRFGWFGDAAVPAIAWMQYVGVTLAVLRGVLMIFIQPKVLRRTSASAADDRQTLFSNEEASGSQQNIPQHVTGPLSDAQEREEPNDYSSSIREDFITRMTPCKRQAFGVALSLFAGTMFGLQFAPISHLEAKTVCSNAWDYSLSYYFGGFVASLCYTIIYSVAMCNRPFINRETFLPAIVSGLMWVVAQTGLFIANETLSLAVTYPITASCTPLVSLFWSTLVFREIRGRTNIILLVCSIVIGFASVFMVAFSR